MLRRPIETTAFIRQVDYFGAAGESTRIGTGQFQVLSAITYS